jgi:4-hydroxybenzoate polyprenyl transferase
MKDFILFLDLIRLKKPIGVMLLFWPCLWGLTLANDFTSNNLQYVIYFIYFFLGSFLMRSAGCIVNDILDRKYDILVERTKQRPIASGKISVKLSMIYVIILCSFAFLILIQFNFTTILLGLASMPFAFSYPLMKRYTYWPQLFLGFTFNYGLIMAWFSIKPEFSYIPIIFYIGAIFWTLAYDTIYGFQDIKDDEIIGVKSTSIKFKNNPKLFIFLCYLIFIFIQIFSGVLMGFNHYYFIGIIVIALHLLIFQTLKLDVSNTKMCLAKFKSNNFLGLLIFLNILINKIYL